MLTIAQKIFGSANDRLIKPIKNLVQQINLLEPNFVSLSDEDLAAKTLEFKREFQNGRTLDDLLPQAFAVVREAAKRCLGMRHFDVQLIGGVVLHRGMVAEMKTGEGKTLVAPLAAYLNSLSGLGVHIVTVNDYLAKRDSQWMGRLYNALGVTVGCIVNDMPDYERKRVYQCDVLYSTNNELGFDYLRDNMKFSYEDMVQRGFHYAIVDEVDSILIDEARTPLIISGAVNEDLTIYRRINKIVGLLSSESYEVDEKQRSIYLTEQGSVKVEELLKSYGLIAATSSLYDEESVVMMHYVDQALKARELFLVDRDYIIKDKKIIIVDPFTGRMMEGRRYSDGLHQAIEAKENVDIQNENQTLASTTFQNYFRMYKKLAGMTGTAVTEAEELWGTYGLQVAQIPTNLPVKRIDLDDDIYCTEQEKYGAIITFIKECHEKLQPVLVGTISIEKSEILSKLFRQNQLKHSILNARYHEQEAQIIAQAGRPGAITIATNMAGRGTDIQLGGNPEMMMQKQNYLQLGEEQRNELYQKITFEIKRDHDIVIAAGGLCVIGTERHESRRIDNQLRGRSGRQGDPGLSKFFLSLEDDLLRIFGSDKITGMLQKFGLKKGDVITHPWISRALEKAQTKVESHNYDIRKSLLRYDNVINEQRHVMFLQRNQILSQQEHGLDQMYEDFNHNLIKKMLPKNLYECTEEKIMIFIDGFDKVYGVSLDAQLLLNFSDNGEVEIHVNDLVKSIFSDKEAVFGEKLWLEVVSRVLIVTLDYLWREHLSALDSLRQGISLRAIGQKDPLNEYKKEAFLMFKSMLDKWQELILHKLAHVKLEDEKRLVNRSIVNVGDEHGFAKIARNDKCPCGSGKKYKHCHGQV